MTLSQNWAMATSRVCWVCWTSINIQRRGHKLICFCFVFNTPEGFTTMVDNEDLEKARAYLNQFPRDQWLCIPSERYGANLRWNHLQNTPTHLFWAELSRLLGEEIPVAIVGLEPGTPGSVVQHFNHLATKQPHWGGRVYQMFRVWAILTLESWLLQHKVLTCSWLASFPGRRRNGLYDTHIFIILVHSF